VNGMATSPEASTDVMDQRRSSQVAALSPCQCAAYAPEPGKLDLRGACQVEMVAGSMRRPSTCLAWTLGVRLPYALSHGQHARAYAALAVGETRTA